MQETAQENAFGFAHLWASGDIVSHSVAVILALMSIASWYLILAKTWDWWTMRRAARAMSVNQRPIVSRCQRPNLSSLSG
jgi:biopolymer transport protein ExbB